ncbi:aminotransferase class I/II-fold pyridoxal phosphate-dependent enzyme [Natronolimnobius sp. AArcel1]|uniref:pyridoxal phosphate-dependent aminotransferase n=1 Tax=Natronolimnobius sp. AArcel1 TaxID=1679093 RepID=UPI0013E9BA27|nr:aminotransferase class I/II-fold pyridoxal phosphate-dependent enzyme [Natronolimnobius sp. AArcel1]NGM70930.1 aminotransferase class I/II-fold pyridoxal phosphate-dependent enzyme [Natronolimnobius sp. AArcel1]
MTFELADRVQSVPPSGIRRFFEIAEERDDVISLGVGEPDFATPWAARDAAITSLEQGKTSYTANRGKRELREAISDYVADRFDLGYGPDEEIIATAGASEAVDLAFRALVNPGDTVAVAQPSYISYGPGVTFAGGEVLPVPTTEENDFRLTVDALEQAGANEADLLVFCYPNNPTGAIMRESDLEPIAEFVREHDLTVLADEIYAELTYDGHTHTSIATLPGMRERTVVFNGFSKAHAMTGLRLGYALGPAEVIGAMNKIHQYTMLSAPTTAQYAALEALESCENDVQEMVSQYDRRRQFILSRFREIGMDVFDAKGAFYCFPEVPEGWTAEEFAEELLHEQGVAVVPGDVFGAGGDNHLRVSYATGLEDIREALARIEAFLADH